LARQTWQETVCGLGSTRAEGRRVLQPPTGKVFFNRTLQNQEFARWVPDSVPVIGSQAD
jgi:hypothetical protein